MHPSNLESVLVRRCFLKGRHCPVLHIPRVRMGRTIDRCWKGRVMLQEFIAIHRDEIIRRCRAKVATMAAPLPTTAQIDHGVPVFLDQLIRELGHGPSNTKEIGRSAGRHGDDLWR